MTIVLLNWFSNLKLLQYLCKFYFNQIIRANKTLHIIMKNIDVKEFRNNIQYTEQLQQQQKKAINRIYICT